MSLAARRPVCPVCQTRVCMEGVCAPPAPRSREEHAAEVARSAAWLVDCAQRLARARVEARHAGARFERALAELEPETWIESYHREAQRKWDQVEALLRTWQSGLAEDLRIRIRAREAGVDVKV